MALVRCPKHDIPYNDDNPRGCPACASEKTGEQGIMQELARASRARQTGPVTRDAATPGPKTPPQAQPEKTPGRQETLNELFRGTAASINEEAPPIETVGSKIQGIYDRTGDRKILKLGIPLLVILVAVVWFTNTAKYSDQRSPGVVASPLPFPVQPGAPVEILFSVLGTQPPGQHPSDRRLARYQYGSDLVVDALNNAIYSITFRVPNRTWQGLSVGMSAESALGALALLGTPVETGDRNPPLAERHGKYQVYANLDARPLRQFKAEVRPPNGCLDVTVDVRYQAQGVLVDGDDRWIVVGQGSQAPVWVATQIQITDRSAIGPASLPPAC